ncbi:type-F conjugative transfer system mating-pair stabilization protein TraN [Cedecea sp. NFIX57]|uniref:type-F conjugative transfer system mating-pair stabilization protein TraN n=1 Tax=Cedecea sp. NFIX57 TaxID=1566286 RepID=UPI000A0B1698|nr:type-F conjugative transfer system mating-pair stabilization protein TraN [Cedecea sp. NFIX57]SMG60302.1 conjugal transfer mating pair stabilization protein TraN [Cedecea sp. NFIX57]
MSRGRRAAGMMILVLLQVGGCLAPLPAGANDDFNRGMQYARSVQGKGLDSLKTFKPEETLPGYNSQPDATKYYGGVEKGGQDMTAPGTSTLNNAEWGKAVLDSGRRQPKDMVTPDSPFLKNAQAAQTNAKAVFDPKLCQEKTYQKNVFTNVVCDRDLQVQQTCTRTAGVAWDSVSGTARQQLVVSTWTLPAVVTRESISGTWTAPVSGQITRITYRFDAQNMEGAAVVYSAFGSSFSMPLDQAGAGVLSSPLQAVTAGQQVVFSHSGIAGAWDLTQLLPVQFIVDIDVPAQVWQPRVTWSESCPFDKAEGHLTGSQCIQPGGDRVVYQAGKPYTVHQDCWQWRDSYLTQSDSEGTCGAYLHNKACNVVKQQCADAADGACLHASVTFSCASTVQGKGQVCGDELFCTDGNCMLDNNNKNKMFAKAASELAAVAAAGKDVADLNSQTVHIFTGKARTCKKFAAGFSNCCQDDGWGKQVGLANCSSEEKALGEAKNRRLTVYVGEYCSKKVLGVCLEKKRGYCEFESKLAQLVQQQGRAWQLGIGFGSGESPDCRGMTPEELQRIDFSRIDFSVFYADLNSHSAIPQDEALQARMRQRMDAMFSHGSSH